MIHIKPSASADSRTAKGNVDKETLLKSSVQHIGDVQKATAWFAGKLIEAGANHDHTKISGIDDFYTDFCSGATGADFKSKKWYQSHLEERHHLTDRCPDDVTLLDVMERIADIVMAGMGRSGSVYSDVLDSEILQKAYANTIELLKKHVVVDKS